MSKSLLAALALILTSCPVHAADYHVSIVGDDKDEGSNAEPFRTIQRAADLAQPGDTITVHDGTYRERINPPRGGTADNHRIVYQAADGEEVIVKGSEVIKGWSKVKNDTWKVSLPNTMFGDYNPYATEVHGDWYKPLGGKNRVYHTGNVFLNGHWLDEAVSKEEVLGPTGDAPLWFAEVDSEQTTLYAQFAAVNPNQELVEIVVRKAVFYPEQTSIDFITVRGFTLEQAAPNWAPPTAEQVGLIGTHWSKGWLIENNKIRYSTCTGITLGKYGDEWDNRAESAIGYVGTIKRALENGWSKENIGHHIVRNNHISYCEQAGIVGSMGAAFSTVTGNTIHEINKRGIFGGAEMAGIKFHGAVDSIISNNHIFSCHGAGGIWLDWMTQGTRVTGNLCYENRQHDLFVEVNHGPFMIDNNLFLSTNALRDMSEGGAYVHNLFAGNFSIIAGSSRETPYLEAHSTAIAGIERVQGGDSRFYNNLFVTVPDLSPYDEAALKPLMAGNVFLNGAKPSKHEPTPRVLSQVDPGIKLVKKSDGVYLEITFTQDWAERKRPRITSEILGKALVSGFPFVAPDDSPYEFFSDYLGKARNAENPTPGPLEVRSGKQETVRVWPKK